MGRCSIRRHRRTVRRNRGALTAQPAYTPGNNTRPEAIMNARSSLLLVALIFPLAPAAAQHAAGGGTRAVTPPPEASQFDFLVGEWEVTLTPKVSGLAARIHGAPKLAGTWTAVRAFDGWGIQDELRVVDASGNPSSLTSTMRFYDQAARQWTQHSLDVYRGRFAAATATFAEGQMTVTTRGTDQEGRPYVARTRFFAITPASFRVQQDRSMDDGRKWDESVLRMEARRTAPARR
jgi:hypothetical protein